MNYLKIKKANFLLNMVNKTYFLRALDSYYDEDNEVEFKKHNKITFKQAEQAQKDLINFLANNNIYKK